MNAQHLTELFFALAAVVLLARLLGAVARRFDQPAVIGEVLAGILMGPTLFGGAVSDHLFPAGIRPGLGVLAAVGVAVFMFVVGLEWDPALARGSGGFAVTVSLSSVLLPFGLGAALAVYLMREYDTPDRAAFVLFMGIAMSITAFPVLARILTDRGMERTTLGVLALACASIDDVLAWSVLAGVAALSGAAGPGPARMLLALPYVLGMLFVLRPLLRQVLAYGSTARLTPAWSACALVGMLASAATTEWVGLHFIFGAFLFGAVIPRERTAQLRAGIRDQFGRLSDVLLLPVFFVVAGLNVDLSGLSAGGLGDLGLILLVAIGGKFAGAFLAARAHGMPSRQSAALATLMNTRGLTELIALSVGLNLGIIQQDLYSLMVVMAVVTTAMAGPLLRWLLPRRLIEAEAARESVSADSTDARPDAPTRTSPPPG
ncbi:cation:proton antiporter [Streptomyces sp. CB03238]|uniref:cation:proton antiporter n=1 Tax=Streptomyces sp. CB03238 TaxID=1907777 RepID=UPI000A1089E6|nr:cation:proton antiporter [Streptomyces sp. CB03238]ORT57412.1 cation/H(+) antiporter [Streptomyces sp. CB03238]DAC74151.1 TPA_exp: Na/H exchanger [Streptomyces sp. CB03238]